MRRKPAIVAPQRELALDVGIRRSLTNARADRASQPFAVPPAGLAEDRLLRRRRGAGGRRADVRRRRRPRPGPCRASRSARSRPRRPSRARRASPAAAGAAATPAPCATFRGVYQSPGISSRSISRLIIISMSVSSPPCSGVTNEIAMPSRPMRPGAADAVDVVLDVHRQVVVDDVRDARPRRSRGSSRRWRSGT